MSSKPKVIRTATDCLITDVKTTGNIVSKMCGDECRVACPYRLQCGLCVTGNALKLKTFPLKIYR